jgi:hypothetical protein
MAVVLKRSNQTNFTESEPVLYIDSINAEGYIAEMYNITVRYIRENTQQLDKEVKKENHTALDENDIYKKIDGYWAVYDGKDKSVSLYLKKTLFGMIYNSVVVEKIFILTCKKCPKIIPQLVNKPSKFENFQMELISRVTEHRKRSDVSNNVTN